jgi:hypothetical protein
MDCILNLQKTDALPINFLLKNENRDYIFVDETLEVNPQ